MQDAAQTQLVDVRARAALELEQHQRQAAEREQAQSTLAGELGAALQAQMGARYDWKIPAGLELSSVESSLVAAT
eukprot:COSAG01_NODE_39178_length_480_cov_0.640420_1_plen_75_part_00